MAAPKYIRELADAAALSGAHYGIVDQGADGKRVLLSVLKTFYLATLAAADITDSSANGRAILTAANYAAMRALLDLEAGTDFLSPAAITAAYQPLDSDLTAIAALTTASFGRGLLVLANAAELRDSAELDPADWALLT